MSPAWIVRCSVSLALACAWLPAAVVGYEDLTAAQAALQDGRPAAVLEILAQLPSADTPFNASDQRQRAVAAATLRGRALLELERYDEARQAYGRALAWDAEQQAAAEGLIQSLSLLQDWPALQAVVGRWALRPESRPELLLVAIDAARENADPLLSLDLARLGVARHPADRRFHIRRAQALTAVGDELQAEHAWRELVRAEPEHARWWQTLAAVRHGRGAAAASRQALAVAYAAAPDDHDLGREYLVSLLTADQAVAALHLARQLLADADAEPSLLLLAVRAAWQAEDHEQAQTWLQRLPEAQRGSDWQRWSLQLAVATGDHQQARRAAEALIASGEATASIRLHAARLAEAAGDGIAAEAHTRVVLQDEDPDLVHLARLHLARLLLARERLDEAERLLRAALDTRPGDVAAARLFDALRRAQLADAR